jgi:uncharacterized MAPEG superfamily protein
MPNNTIFLYSIIAASALVYAPFLVVGYARVNLGYDISAPRAMFDRLPAYAQRATWAHQNSFETFMLFTAAALMAYVTGVESSLASYAAIAFVIARLFYSAFYILNIPIMRSLMFATGGGATFTLFVLSILKVNSSTI